MSDPSQASETGTPGERTALLAVVAMGSVLRFAYSDLPLWFDEIVNVAFRNNFIDSIDHPILKRLRGEV